ncbi:universal stress protein [Mycobacterium sp. KBS0706]|uniref:universal stress protein n=1 Tax=Mycobacterium sp. KBS0706 TaxID=2578109 RepID=UPI00110FA6CA|nr:universal stress protein [Mycobacterium sp. KBS0706]TSD85460.1 universal stress protein [Mycobacterium sp. KBS0706]
MFEHILIPTDGSPLAERAVDRGLRLAAAFRASVTLLTVFEPFHVFSLRPAQLSVTEADYEDAMRQRGHELLTGGMTLARDLGVTCEPVVVGDEQPYRAIIDVATERRCDLIAMASHGRRGVSALVLGSETQKVLTHSKIPVLVFR